MRTRSIALLTSLLGLGACSNLLGLEQPAADVPGSVDASVDAMPALVTLRVVVNGSGTLGHVDSTGGDIDCGPPNQPEDNHCSVTVQPGTHVTLNLTQSTAFTTGFHGGGCNGETGNCEVTVDDDTTVYARFWANGNSMFVTSATAAPGSFDGLEHIDQFCNDAATAAGVPGHFVAWVPEDSSSAAMRIMTQNGSASLWSRTDGKVFAGGLTELGDGRVFFPPRLDEWGEDVGDDALVMTDTLPSNAPGTGAGTHCSNWSNESPASQVLAGEASGATGRWTAATQIGCNEPAHVYCFATDLMTLAAFPPPSATIVFVSEGVMSGDQGVAAADAMCQNEASAGGLGNPTTRALLPLGNGKSVADRFGSGPGGLGLGFTGAAVTRPDGFVIAPSMAALLQTAGTRFASAPNVNAQKQYRDVDVWLGAGDLNEKATATCNGWSATTGSFGKTRHAASTADATHVQQISCGEAHHVLCVNAVVSASAQ